MKIKRIILEVEDDKSKYCTFTLDGFIRQEHDNISIKTEEEVCYGDMQIKKRVSQSHDISINLSCLGYNIKQEEK